MTEVPKIVYDRLRTARTLPDLLDHAHPDADLLTAFAERSLSATERDSVLHHLASCGDCREVIALALPPVDAPILPAALDTETREPQYADSGRARRTSLGLASMKPAWLKPGALHLGSGLQWAALAAGVVVAASVLALYPGRSSRQVATNTVPTSNAQIASTSTPMSPVAPSAETAPESASKPAEVRRPLGLPRSDAAKNSTIAADNVLDKTPRRRLANSPAIAVPEVTSQMSTVSNLMTRNEAPAIEKAKPALPSAQAADSNSPKDEQDNVPSDNELTKQLQSRDASSTSALSTTRLAGTRMSASKIGAVPVYGLDQRHWTVAGGVLQRSADGGQSWQESLRPSHPLLCFTNHGEEIWAGGQAGVLFHSTNGGATWAQVQPSSTSQRLSADITHIDLQGDAPETTRIAISTRNNEMWISTNGGKTWEKK